MWLCAAGRGSGTGTRRMADTRGHTHGGGMPPWQQNTCTTTQLYLEYLIN